MQQLVKLSPWEKNAETKIIIKQKIEFFFHKCAEGF